MQPFVLCEIMQNQQNTNDQGQFLFLVFSNISLNGLSSVIVMKINATW